MESRIKLLVHPIHPMLIVYPLGLLSTAVIFDVLYVITGNGDLATSRSGHLPRASSAGLQQPLRTHRLARHPKGHPRESGSASYTEEATSSSSPCSP